MLYYVDVSTQPIIEEFVPRIPENRMAGEDDKVERICLAKTLEGCITASSEFEKFQFRHKDCPYEIFRLYIFDENDIEVGNLTDSYELWYNNLVPDANITGEVWIKNQHLKPKEVKYLSIKHYNSEKVVQLSFKELKELDEEFHISDAFSEKNYILLDDFTKLTKECETNFLRNVIKLRKHYFETKIAYSNLEIQFYEEEELLFSKNQDDLFGTDDMIINLSKEFPNMDFRRFNDSTMRTKMREFVYNTFFDFIEEGFKFFYGTPVIRKEGFLELFTK